MIGSRASRSALATAGVLTLAGCRACGRPTEGAGAAPATSAAVARREAAPTPALPTFAPIRGSSGFALPGGCVERAPALRAPVAEGSHLDADAATLGAVALSSPSGEDDGAAAVFMLDGAAARVAAALPRRRDEEPLRLARGPDGWLAALAEGGAGETAVLLWRGLAATPLGPPDRVGQGDGFVPSDLACGPSRCVLLTPRPSRVAGPGAEIWVGAPGDPVARWRRWSVEAGDKDARPRAVVSVDPTAVVVLREEDDAVAFAIDETGPRESSRVAVDGEILGAALAPDLVVLSGAAPAAGEPDCLPDVPVRVARAGAAPIRLRAAATPLATAVRALERGALALWLSPLGCAAERRVLWGIVAGAPAASPAADAGNGQPSEAGPMAVGDASAFAVASRGAEVDLWTLHGTSLTWLRMRCAAP